MNALGRNDDVLAGTSVSSQRPFTTTAWRHRHARAPRHHSHRQRCVARSSAARRRISSKYARTRPRAARRPRSGAAAATTIAGDDRPDESRQERKFLWTLQQQRRPRTGLLARYACTTWRYPSSRKPCSVTTHHTPAILIRASSSPRRPPRSRCAMYGARGSAPILYKGVRVGRRALENSTSAAAGQTACAATRRRRAASSRRAYRSMKRRARCRSSRGGACPARPRGTRRGAAARARAGGRLRVGERGPLELGALRESRPQRGVQREQMRRVAPSVVDLVRRERPPAPVTVLEPSFENRGARGPRAVHDGAGPQQIDEAEGQLQRRRGDLRVPAVHHSDPEVLRTATSVNMPKSRSSRGISTPSHEWKTLRMAGSANTARSAGPTSALSARQSTT